MKWLKDFWRALWWARVCPMCEGVGWLDSRKALHPMDRCKVCGGKGTL